MTWHQLPEDARNRISDTNDTVMTAVGTALDLMTPDAWMAVGDARAEFVLTCNRAGINPEDALPHL